MLRSVLLLLFFSLPALAKRPGPCAFALRAHAGQTYGARPFSDHLWHVQEVLRHFGYDESYRDDRLVFAVAWLHDVIEDTRTTYETVLRRFGPRIARAVWALSLDPALTRRAALEQSLVRMAPDPLAITAKLADRIANVETCRFADTPCYTAYVAEWAYLREPFRLLAKESRAQAMWTYLDTLHQPEPAKYQ